MALAAIICYVFFFKRICWCLFLFMGVGYEALFLLKLVRKFSKICVCFFPLDIIFSWDICVRKPVLFLLSMFNLFVTIYFCWFLCRFIYMGFDIAMEQHSWSHVGFIFFSIVSLSCLSRCVIMIKISLTICNTVKNIIIWY